MDLAFAWKRAERFPVAVVGLVLAYDNEIDVFLQFFKARDCRLDGVAGELKGWVQDG